jgi:CDP-6-deoxy-D-xylo-4-hexulose-3-dehydrase
MPVSLPDSDPSWFGFPLSVKKSAPFLRSDIVKYLEQNKVATRMLFSGNIVRHPAFDSIKCRISGTLENTDYIMKNTFWIGVYPGLTEEMLSYMVSVFDGFFKELAAGWKYVPA